MAGAPCIAMALAAAALCDAQARAIASAHNVTGTHSIRRRRNPATPFRLCLGEKEFETIRFTEGECIMTHRRPLLPYGSCSARLSAAEIGTGRRYSQTWFGFLPGIRFHHPGVGPPRTLLPLALFGSFALGL